MAVSKNFKKDVLARNMQNVYEQLSDIMIIDPSLKMQDEMLKYAEIHLHNFYQPHDDEHLQTENHDDDYYDLQRYNLEKNFSKERLGLVRKMTLHRSADTIKLRDECEKLRAGQSKCKKIYDVIRPTLPVVLGFALLCTGRRAKSMVVFLVCMSVGVILIVIGGILGFKMFFRE